MKAERVRVTGREDAEATYKHFENTGIPMAIPCMPVPLVRKLQPEIGENGQPNASSILQEKNIGNLENFPAMFC